MDLGLNADGDLNIEGGLSLVDDISEKAQYLRLGLNLNLGEWFLDINRGLPWLFNPEEPELPSNVQYFLGDALGDTSGFITAQIKKYIERQTFVESTNLISSFNPATKTYELRGTITSNKGDVIELIPYIQELA